MSPRTPGSWLAGSPSPEPLREPRDGAAHVEVAAPRAAAWPRAERHLSPRISGAGRDMDIDEFHAVTASTAIVVVADGVLVHERYFGATTPEDRLLGYSVTKSALALLTGRAVSRGALADLDAPVSRYVPELDRSGYAAVTLRQLLTMTSGTSWLEDYHDATSAASELLRRYREGAGGLRRALVEIAGDEEPGTRFSYCSPDSLVLDWVRERATGQPFAEALAEVWERVGAERPAVVGLDADLARGGVAMAAGALAATARDWARIGALQIDGCWEGERLLTAVWVEESSRPRHGFTRPGRLPSTITTHAGFGYHWWPLDDHGATVMADGMRGQFIYVDRRRRIVVVKASAWAYDDPWRDRQCRDLCYLALPAIADAVAGSR